MSNMRAKMTINEIKKHADVSETIYFNAVCKPEGYPEDGADENNTFARYTPSAQLEMLIANPNLVGTFKIGQTFYIDFTETE